MASCCLCCCCITRSISTTRLSPTEPPPGAVAGCELVAGVERNSLSSKGSKGVRLLSYRSLTGSKQQSFLLGSVVRDFFSSQRHVHRRTLWASMHTSGSGAAMAWVLNTGAGVTLSAPLPCEKQMCWQGSWNTSRKLDLASKL